MTKYEFGLQAKNRARKIIRTMDEITHDIPFIQSNKKRIVLLLRNIFDKYFFQAEKCNWFLSKQFQYTHYKKSSQLDFIFSMEKIENNKNTTIIFNLNSKKFLTWELSISTRRACSTTWSLFLFKTQTENEISFMKIAGNFCSHLWAW